MILAFCAAPLVHLRAVHGGEYLFQKRLMSLLFVSAKLLQLASRLSWLRPIDSVKLNGLHSHDGTQLLEDNKLDCGGGGKPRPDGHETTPESQRSLILGNLHHAIQSVVVDLGIRGLVHQAGSNHVEWGHRACHEESSSDGRKELGHNGLLGQACQSNHVSLGLVVAGHLSSIQHHGTRNVGVNTTVESTNSLLSQKLLGGAADGGNLQNEHNISSQCVSLKCSH